MKILTFTRLISVFVVLVLAGCAKSPDEEGQGQQDLAIKVGADISTRAVDASWNDNDVIGITMFKHGTTTLADGLFSNRKYVVPQGSSGVFNAFGNSSIVYFPKDGSTVDFLAYYPYSSLMDVNYNVPVNVSDQSSLPKIDLMRAQHLSGDSKDNPSVKFRFYHKLSKIVVNLQTQSGDSPARLQGSRITVKGMYTAGSYDLVNSNLTVNTGVSSAVNFDIFTDVLTGATAQGIVLPRAAAAGVTFEIALTDGSKYTARMDQALTLTSGYQYVFYITLNKTQIDVSATIEPWGDGGRSDLTALAIATTAGTSSGVNVGDVMSVFGAGNYLGAYTYGANGLWTTTNSVYWENLAGAQVTFNATITSALALNGTQTPDYLVAAPVTVARDNGVNFVLSHAAAKVMVGLVSSDGSFSASDLAGATITLPSYKGGGSLSGGLFVPGSTVQNIVLVSGVALIQPQTINAGVNLIKVTINGKDYFVPAPSGGIAYQAGKVTQINLNVLKTSIAVSAKVIDWVADQNVNLQTRYVAISTPGASNTFVAGNSVDMFILNNALSTTFTYQPNSTWTTTNPIYWDNIATTPIEVAAVYPSGQVVPTNKTVPWNVFANQSAGSAPSDLLVAYQSSIALGAAANMTFYHAMSKIAVVLVEGTGFTGLLSGAMVTVKNMPTHAVVNLTDLSVSSVSSYTDVTPYKDSNLHYSALIVPNTVATNTQLLNIVINGDSYPVTLTSAMTFSATKVNTITVTVNKTPIGISCQVEGWTTGINGGYIIN